MPAQKNLLANKLKVRPPASRPLSAAAPSTRLETDELARTPTQERKYFDSGDYAMSKAGVSPPQSVGTAIPSPADIPHAQPAQGGGSSSSGAIGIPGASTSPGSGGGGGGSYGSSGSPSSPGVGVGVSPGKGGEGPFGSPSKEPISQHRPHGEH